MDTSGVIQLVSIVILIFLSGFFSSAETALSTVNRVRMRTLEEEGSKRAARVNKVLDNYSKMISTILIGNNIVNLTASSLATSFKSFTMDFAFAIFSALAVSSTGGSAAFSIATVTVEPVAAADIAFSSSRV